MKVTFIRSRPVTQLNSKFQPSEVTTRVIDGKTFKVVNAGDSIISAIEPKDDGKTSRVKRFSTLIPRN